MAFLFTRIVFWMSLVLAGALFLYWLGHERKVIHYELADEVTRGHVTEEECRIVPRIRERWMRYLRLFRQGRTLQMQQERALHDVAARLALLKWSSNRSKARDREIERRRIELAARRDLALKLGADGLQDP